MRIAPIILISIGFSCFACSSSESLVDVSPSQEQQIYYGSPDTTHQAVVALAIDARYLCSATIVEVKGHWGYVLTAAHCLKTSVYLPTPASKIFVRVGDSLWSPSITYPAVETAVHPMYTGFDGVYEPNYDFGMIRFAGATPSTPVIPAMTPEEDNLYVGVELDQVGYGLTHLGPDVSERNHIVKPIVDLTSTHAFFNQFGENGGTCFGDSGGPSLSLGIERVAGVTSYGTSEHCDEAMGAVGRVSSVYHSFIKPFIDKATADSSCDNCWFAAEAQGGACSAKSDACHSNATCMEYVNCVYTCVSNACKFKCLLDYPEGANKYNETTDCQCNKCSACAAEPRCNVLVCGFELANATCGQCSDANCCDLELDCSENKACSACTKENRPDSCDSNIRYNRWQRCLSAKCATECDLEEKPCGLSTQGTSIQGSKCKTCVESGCCEEASTCAENWKCRPCAEAETPDESCFENDLFQHYLSCANNLCPIPCLEESSDSGSEPSEEAGLVPPKDASEDPNLDSGNDPVDATANGNDSSSDANNSHEPDYDFGGGCNCAVGGHKTISAAWLLIGFALAVARLRGSEQRRQHSRPAQRFDYKANGPCE